MSAECVVDAVFVRFGTEEGHMRILKSILQRGLAIFVVTAVGLMAAAPAMAADATTATLRGTVMAKHEARCTAR
jgi:hypothetical protein